MNILIRPIVTEKMTKQGETLNRYGFIVDKRAEKLQIKNAVEKMYEVKVIAVNTMRYAGKSKTRYTKTGVQRGKTNAFKKAIITLAQGEVIDFYSNI
ncbi:MAG: 50S ribosomal protein L23 [Bacteroidales bacterium]|jgi:large subunit ribosomal protein L23|nr:50S ribosomal protein L23 [Bacteroidales bacterium]MCK9498146.1 50S ribosomal protein L23 [Bacteroidales bacterium]MDY0313712.1 50S ribosomal protein L23 [Bacteroidales bacterium]NLB86822.1 50S ribosomal protein L23 [Bacteroidales bacterium]